MVVKQSIHIAAPVETVFDFWADPRNQERVMPFGGQFTEVRRTEGGVGTYYAWRMRLFGALPVSGFDVFTEFVPNERITDRSSLGVAGTWTYTFRPEGSGTRFTLWRHPTSEQLLQPVDALLDRYRARVTEKMLDTLKAEVEKRTAALAAPAP